MNSNGKAEPKWMEHVIEGGSDGWFRGEVCNRFPRERDATREYETDEVIRWVVGGWAPREPILSRQDTVTAFGSCFAYEVERTLRLAGYRTSLAAYGTTAIEDKENIWENSLIIKCSEGHVNTMSIRAQFEWVYDETMAPLKIWNKSGGVIKEYIDNNRAAARSIFDSTTFFIITLGLSEVWYNKITDEVLWTSVPKAEYDPDIYGFRLLTVEENLANLWATLELIRQHKGPVPVVFTLSPVALSATFRPIPAISATSVSKALLRVAVDELLRTANDPDLYYFPSFEIVTGYLKKPMGPDHQHPTEDAVNLIMDTFLKLYAKSEPAPPAASGPPSLPWATVDSFQGNVGEPEALVERDCPMCGSTGGEILFDLPDFQFFTDSTDQPRRLRLREQICRDCGQVFMNPSPPAPVFRRLVAEANRPGPGEWARDAHHWLADRQLLPKAGDIVLAIGCQAGEFLSILGEGVLRMGIESDASFRFETAEGARWLEVDPPSLFILSDLAFMPDPGAVLRRLRALARDGARLFLQVPLQPRQPHDVFGFFSPVMANAFTVASLTGLLAHTGWEVEQGDHGRVYARPAIPSTPRAPGGRRAFYTSQAFGYQHLAAIEAGLARIRGEDKLIIWGCGMHTELLYHLTSLFPGSPGRKVLLVDSNPELQGRSWRGIPILAPAILQEAATGSVPVLLSTAQRFGLNSMKAQARAMGLSPDRMVTLYRPLEPGEVPF